jgi:hypothetical protein
LILSPFISKRHVGKIFCTTVIVMVLEGTWLLGNAVANTARVWKELGSRKAETLVDVEEAASWWRNNLPRFESGLRCCDIGWWGVVVTIRKCIVVSKMLGCDSDGTSEHENRFKCGSRIVYMECVVSVGGCQCLLSWLVLLYSKALYNLETASTVPLSWFPWNKSQVVCFIFRYHIWDTDITYIRPIPLH